VFGDVSTGAQDDLHKVSELARAMVTTYGMSDAVGLLTYDQPTSPFLPGPVPAPSRAHSEDTARTIDHEVRTIVDQAHEQVRQILGENKDALERLARRLLDQEVLEGAELQNLLATQAGISVAAFSPRERRQEA
jgi:cell division protease FtsH